MEAKHGLALYEEAVSLHEDHARTLGSTVERPWRGVQMSAQSGPGWARILNCFAL
jgi:hypothetical protein